VGNYEWVVAAKRALTRRPSGAERYLPGSRVCMSAQHNVTAKTPKAAAMIVATMISVGIDLLPCCGENDAGKSDEDFDLDQIWIDHFRPAAHYRKPSSHAN
jgi:hypothetical protein